MSRAQGILLALIGLLVAVSVAGRTVLAVGATVVGSGMLTAGGAPAWFYAQVDGDNPPYFEYWDYGSDPPRDIALVEAGEVKCVGQLFGGQTLRIKGSGLDTATGETVDLQVFLVDGGAAGPDRMSLKATRSNGKTAYFVSMRDLDSGDLVVGCP